LGLRDVIHGIDNQDATKADIAVDLKLALPQHWAAFFSGDLRYSKISLAHAGSAGTLLYPFMGAVGSSFMIWELSIASCNAEEIFWGVSEGPGDAADAVFFFFGDYVQPAAVARQPYRLSDSSKPILLKGGNWLNLTTYKGDLVARTGTAYAVYTEV